MGAAGKKQVMIISGEASGDIHGAQVVQAMRRKQPDIQFIGMGGSAMAAAGVHILVDAAELSVMGITEVLTRSGAILKGFQTIKEALRQLRPDLLILIDFPDFNLRIAKRAKALGIRVLYYISPQIWAWRTGRVRIIKQRVDHMAVIFPFETAFFHDNGVPATYVGHPLLDHAWPDPVEPAPTPYPVIGLLPGSRKQEIERHMPTMLDSLTLISQNFQNAHYMLAPAHEDQEPIMRAMVDSRPVASRRCKIVPGGARALFPKCHLVIAASGTVTLEAALAGVPMVVLYKVSPFSYLLGRLMIRVDHISLVNLVARKAIVPELIQHQATAEMITAEITAILKTEGRLEWMRRQLALVRERLGTSGAAERVARLAFNLLSSSKNS